MFDFSDLTAALDEVILQDIACKKQFEQILAEKGYALVPVSPETVECLTRVDADIEKLLRVNEPEEMLDVEYIHPEAVYGTCPLCGRRLEQGDTYKRCPYCGKKVIWRVS